MRTKSDCADLCIAAVYSHGAAGQKGHDSRHCLDSASLTICVSGQAASLADAFSRPAL